MSWPLALTLLLCLLALTVAGLRAYGSRRWASAMQLLTHQLEAGRIGPQTPSRAAARFDPRELDGLPEPVQRYFALVLTPGQPLIAAARIGLTGTFNVSAAGEQWEPFTSTQQVITHRPGFLWDASVALWPGLPVRVVDGYVAGEGMLRAAVLGLFTVADTRGGGEMARDEFMRWLAEAAWYPTALLPSQGVRWEAVDDRSASATIGDGELALTLLFRFDDTGLIAAVRAAARGAGVGSDRVMLPWEGCWSQYQRHKGMLLPMVGEAAWLRPQGRRAYFRGTVRQLRFEFLP
jgi:hypothetical protein